MSNSNDTMSSNNDTMSSNNNNDSELPVAAAALVVSLVALFATFMQVLQQYIASAQGYQQCNEKVIGEWAKTKSRRFAWEELRFEVQFDAPVIFVCPPKNKFGPVPDATIYVLDGTDESIRDSWTTLIRNPIADYKQKSAKEKIHTADNERASWTTLLSAIQQMEQDSRKWQQDQYGTTKPPRDAFLKNGIPSTPPALHTTHTLSVALQRKRKSWDTMPSNILKPYATTTICHLVEMVAALGVYWKEFDRKRDRYRAEGNGLMVIGENFSDLGLMFSFQVYGKCNFGKNRVMPVDEIKELCFGWVPTIYRSAHDERRLQFPVDELQNLSSLQLSSQKEIAETLVMIGCNTNTVNCFSQSGHRTSHVFSVSFEILGMLCQNFHIRNTYFTYIPNPTPNRWDKRSLSLVKLLESYNEFVQDEHPKDEPPISTRNAIVFARINSHISRLIDHIEKSVIQDILSTDGETHDIREAAREAVKAERLLFLNALHSAIDDADEILTGRSKNPQSSSAEPTGKVAGGTKKSDQTKGLGQETDSQRRRREDVQHVLRLHIQEIMRLLNSERDDRGADAQSLNVPEQEYGRDRANSPGRASRTSRHYESPRFEDMDSAEPDERQHLLMEVYFLEVRPLVIRNAARAAVGRRNSIVSIQRGLRRRSSARTQHSLRSPASDTQSVTPQLPVPSARTMTFLPSKSIPSPLEEVAPDVKPEELEFVAPVPELPSLAEETVGSDDIWCTLIFRMICWLMLHDFNKLDMQLDSKSELLGNRMPVYIS